MTSPHETHRWIYFLLGWTFTFIGFIGVVVPVLPTTPFLILAAYLFSKSSAKWHDWLLTRKGIGPAISHWEQSKSIQRHAKWSATAVLALSISLSCFFTSIKWFAKLALVICALSVLFFIWTRPEPSRPLEKNQTS